MTKTAKIENKKKLINHMIKNTIFLVILLLFPAVAIAQKDQAPIDVFFKAEVVKIIEQANSVLPDGREMKQQHLLLRGREDPFQDQEFEFNGIDDFGPIVKNSYRAGDTVLAVASYDADGNVSYYVTDYVRTKYLWLLMIIFACVLIGVGRVKGLRSLIALALTFLIIIKYIIPQILAGANALVVSFLGALLILLIIIYVTEGWRARSHLAATSIFFSLLFTIFLSWLFVTLAKLTGVASEEVSFLINIGEQAINFKGLLLAGIIIGSLGVLDDIVISQVATVEQIAKAINSGDHREIFKRAYRVGVSHIASMTNTLFLAYAGVALPLLILFISGESAFTSWGQIINNEAIATEIIRTLAGSIGLILSVPITTYLATWWYSRR